MSSTAIVLQTLKEKNLFRTVSGESSFSILLFQDIAVIPILALLPFLSKSESAVKQSEHQEILCNMYQIGYSLLQLFWEFWH
jgi:CPA2 family monovalent cation:H+ antiporter-2